jgi:hypothetical protein
MQDLIPLGEVEPLFRLILPIAAKPILGATAEVLSENHRAWFLDRI